MNSERLSRQAIRQALRASNKLGRPLTREELSYLKIQTADPWERIVVITFGLAGGGFAFFLYWIGSHWLAWVVIGLCSLYVLIRGVVGRRALLERQIAQHGPDAMGHILDAVIRSMWDGI